MKLSKKTIRLIKEHGLTIEEYSKICSLLGRQPNITELGLFSVMWSEHCSYKSSRIFLKNLPTRGERVIQGPGENAGIIALGDGLAVVFKMESHNHPSFIEPFQGAATGVGGIIRDIFTMGARPVALLDSLRFGSIGDSRTRYLVDGVVSGISSYGNCVGIPTVGGDVYFDECYNRNILVNVMCIGIVREDRIFRARAKGTGNSLLYVGSKTGRDGIHGATMASEGFGSGGEERRPTVQVGDPFTEKLLIEACLEAMESGDIVAIQDMGAAGLTSSSVEMAHRGGCGIELNLDLVPRREEGMTPYEIMLSESQERMLIVVEKGKEKKIINIFKKWGLNSVIIGRITDSNKLIVRERGKIVADIPVSPLADYEPLKKPSREPKYLKKIKILDINSIGVPEDIKDVFLKILSSPAIADKSWVYHQYDYTVQTNTVLTPGSDAAVLRIKGSNKAIAATVDVNSRYCYLNPELGATIAVAEAARNLSCVGAEPAGITDCLNFGSPDDPEVLWQFEKSIEGIRKACIKLNIPVVSGNVSFYNETNGTPIFPTPTIGMVGIIEDVTKIAGSSFTEPNNLIGLVGENRAELGGSEYLSVIHDKLSGPPPILNLELEKNVQEFTREAIKYGLLLSAHDCSEGGLAVAIAESCVGNNIGATVELKDNIRMDALLFGESQSRIVVSFPEKNLEELKKLAEKYNVPFSVIGRTGGDNLIVKGVFTCSLEEIKQKWHNGLREKLDAKGL
jgi:phosphoribosylformylglycinamidine synthase